MNFGEMPPAPEQQERPTVPEHEMVLTFVKAGGPGGQNVNKVNTKALLNWNVGKSTTFTDEQKVAIRAYAGNALKEGDYIQIYDLSTRSQGQNRASAIEKLQELVSEALTPEKERKPTKVSRSQKEQRLDDKRREGSRKENRKPPRGDW